MPSFGLGADRIHTGLTMKQLTAGRADRRGYSLADFNSSGRTPTVHAPAVETAHRQNRKGPVLMTCGRCCGDKRLTDD